MRRIATVIAFTLLTACATTKGERYAPVRHVTPAENLARAVDLLQKGDSRGAIRILHRISTDPPVPGVTDEALFRLALLTLAPKPERPASARGEHLLKRLKKEYPASSWSAQATPLIELIEVADELRHQNRNLKAGNQSLKNDNSELARKVDQLNKNIEQLKHLDLELEQKSR